MNETVARILTLIQEHGISAHKLEVESKIAISSIQAWKNGKSKPSLDAVSKIADYFNVSTDYLLGKTDDPTPPRSNTDGSSKLFIPEKYKDVAVAFHGGVDNLTQEDIDDIVRFIEFVKSKSNK